LCLYLLKSNSQGLNNIFPIEIFARSLSVLLLY
jgi:hypothetical protein